MSSESRQGHSLLTGSEQSISTIRSFPRLRERGVGGGKPGPVEPRPPGNHSIVLYSPYWRRVGVSYFIAVHCGFRRGHARVGRCLASKGQARSRVGHCPAILS